MMRARAKRGLEVLKSQPNVDSSRIAAIGYCFGGTTVLELARGGEDIRGVVSFHGGLATPLPAQEGDIRAKVVVMQGADDTHTSEALPAFQDEMRQAGADWQLHIFGGAVHSFTVPSAGADPASGMAYDKKADLRSWALMLDLFDEIFAN